ncbi:hypothetical protein BaRGS_00010227 [Batillaria attramentaria]|uniref:G-protein coupled receptors family 1 profile domain-containing protein n=1 Tax=Batillaria attramentaria TaxID=370345 RepID=A0ABD0LHQ0_9CAEN
MVNVCTGNGFFPSSTDNSTDGIPGSTSSFIPAYTDNVLLLTDDQRRWAVAVLQNGGYVIAAFAIPLTVCNMMVFLRKDMRSATSMYIVALSVSQIIYTLGIMVKDLCERILDDPASSLAFQLYDLYFGVYVIIVAKRGAYVLTCLLSTERLYAVLRPLHIKDFFLSRFPVSSIIGVYTVTAIWHVYILTQTKVIGAEDSHTGKMLYKRAQTDLYLKHKEINDVFGLAAKIVLTFVSLALQIVLNLLTVWALRRHNQSSQSMQTPQVEDRRGQKERQMTVTMLAATVSYVIMSLPAAFHNLCYTIFFPDYWYGGKYSNLFQVMIAFAFDITTLSSATDFLCFVTLSSNYRKSLRKLFQGVKLRKLHNK